MRRIRFLFLIILAVLLLSACEEFDPQWAGVWVDDSTVTDVVIELDLRKWSGTLTVENSKPTAIAKLTIVEASLDGDENTMIAEITSIYRKTGPIYTTRSGYRYHRNELGGQFPHWYSDSWSSD